MAWNVTNQNFSMAEGDYGIALPLEIIGVDLGNQDRIKLTIKTAMNGETILEKNYDGIVDNTVNLEFTEEESALFPVGGYTYCLDWYQNGNFMCNIITSAQFRVVDKA